MREVELSGGVFDETVLKNLKAALQAREKSNKTARKAARELELHTISSDKVEK